MAIIATGFAVATAPACKKDDSGSSNTTTTTGTTGTSVDARDAAIGTYVGITTSTDADTTMTDSVTLIVSKGTGNTLSVSIDNTSFKTSDVVSVAGNLAGNIPSQVVTISGVSFTISGKGNNNEHFSYTKINGVSTFTYDINLSFNGENATEYFIGTKK